MRWPLAAAQRLCPSFRTPPPPPPYDSNDLNHGGTLQNQSDFLILCRLCRYCHCHRRRCCPQLAVFFISSFCVKCHKWRKVMPLRSYCARTEILLAGEGDPTLTSFTNVFLTEASSSSSCRPNLCSLCVSTDAVFLWMQRFFCPRSSVHTGHARFLLLFLFISLGDAIFSSPVSQSVSQPAT